MKIWVLNLDAELELASAGPYQTALHVQQALEPWAARARALLAPGEQTLEDWRRDPERKPGVGECWSPTPNALARLAKAGVALPATPSVQVLRRVCERRFYLELGGGAPGARYFAEPASVEAALEAAGGAPWLFKRAFGFAGRGQRRLRRELSPDDRRWLSDSLGRGALLGEPWLELELELCQHGRIRAEGALELGQPCVQHTDAQRAWLRSEPLAPGELRRDHCRALTAAAERAAEALFRAGYFGPFGIDAYLWRTPAGGLELNALGELNARYTMGFAVGMASR